MSDQLDELQQRCSQLMDIYRAVLLNPSDLCSAIDDGDNMQATILRALNDLRKTAHASRAEQIVGRTIAEVASFSELFLRPLESPGCWN